MAKVLSPYDMCLLLGYDLKRHCTDSLGNKWTYATYPTNGTGGVNYFSNQEQVVKWASGVNEKRRWEFDCEEGAKTLLDFMSEGEAEAQ